MSATNSSLSANELVSQLIKLFMDGNETLMMLCPERLIWRSANTMEMVSIGVNPVGGKWSMDDGSNDEVVWGDDEELKSFLSLNKPDTRSCTTAAEVVRLMAPWSIV